MEQIISLSNAYIKKVKSLKTKKGRDTQDAFLAEGEKCVLEALLHAPVESVLFVYESEATRIAGKKGVRSIEVDQKILEAISDTMTPQNVVAVVKRVFRPLKGGLMLALEDISDPGNVGTMIRTAEAVGCGGVLLSSKCADHYSPKVVRASMGSVLRMSILVAEDFTLELKERKKEGALLIGGALEGGSVLPDGKDRIIVVGSEAHGLSPAIKELCDVLYKINLYGKAESLNAAVACGIMLYRAREGF